MAKTEYQYRRGYSKVESETETEEENILSIEVAPASNLKIAFIQSPNQICDIKQEKKK